MTTPGALTLDLLVHLYESYLYGHPGDPNEELSPDQNLLQRLEYLLKWKVLFPDLKEEELPRLARWTLAAQQYHLNFLAEAHSNTPQPTELSLAALAYGFRQFELRQERGSERVEALFELLTSKRFRNHLMRVIKVMHDHHESSLKAADPDMKEAPVFSSTKSKNVKIVLKQFDLGNQDARQALWSLAESVQHYIAAVIGPKFLVKTLSQRGQSQQQKAEALKRELEKHFSSHKDAKALARAWTELIVHISLSTLRKGSEVTIDSLAKNVVLRAHNALDRLDEVFAHVEDRALEELSTLAAQKRKESSHRIGTSTQRGDSSPSTGKTDKVEIAPVKAKQINTPRQARRKKRFSAQGNLNAEETHDETAPSPETASQPKGFQVELAESLVQSLSRLPRGFMRKLRQAPVWQKLQSAPWEVGERKRKLGRDLRAFRFYFNKHQYRVVFRLPENQETRTITIVEIVSRTKNSYKELERRLNQ